MDGMMLNEVAAFNTAALTGESVPRSIRMGEEVLAGMIVTDKVIRIKVIRPFDKSALARILELVQNASERKAPAELFIRKFADCDRAGGSDCFIAVYLFLDHSPVLIYF